MSRAGGRSVGRTDGRSDMRDKTELSDSGEGGRGERYGHAIKSSRLVSVKAL